MDKLNSAKTKCSECGKTKPAYCYDKDKNNRLQDFCKGCRAVKFFNTHLKLTKGKWYGKQFELMDWQVKIIYDIFGTIKPDGNRQYTTAYIEVPKKNGKSELAAGVALYLLFADHEQMGEVYSAAADRDQAGIVFKVASKMIELNSKLGRKCKVLDSTKRIIHNSGSLYRVLSADAFSKHGYNISGLIFDELHAQKNRELFDTLTVGAGDAREQPLTFIITTAGYDRHSICWEVHQRAINKLNNPKTDSAFYAAIYSADEKEDWTSEKVWRSCNPSLGEILDVNKIKLACEEAQLSPAKENFFRRMRLNQWVKQESRYIPMHAWDDCDIKFNPEDLKDLVWYAGMDLSSNIDLTAFILVAYKDGVYYIMCYCWIPEDNLRDRVKKDKVQYDDWLAQGFIEATPGNVVDQAYIEQRITQICSEFEVAEIAYDRYMAIRMSQNLDDEGFNMIPFGQGMISMSPPTKGLLTEILNGNIAHNTHPVLRWCVDNLVVKQDAAGNFKPDKEKSTERIDLAVGMIMAFDRCQRNENEGSSVYDDEEPIII